MARLLLVHAAVRRVCSIACATLALAYSACTSDIGSSATSRSDMGGAAPAPPGSGSSPGDGSGEALGPDGKPRVSDGCVITGCNDQLCSDHLVSTDCQPTPQDACFQAAICERGDTGSCRWRPTTELHGCLARAAGMSAPDGGPGAGMRGSGSGLASDGGVPMDDRSGGSGGGSGGSGGTGNDGPATGECRQTGCFGELCSDRDVEGGDCQWQNAYACYYATTCEQQPDGRCAWTPTEWLDVCIELSAFGGFGF